MGHVGDVRWQRLRDLIRVRGDEEPGSLQDAAGFQGSDKKGVLLTGDAAGGED